MIDDQDEEAHARYVRALERRGLHRARHPRGACWDVRASWGSGDGRVVRKEIRDE